MVIRQREIVIARPLDGRRTTALAKPLERIQAKLAAGGIRLAIGVSTTLQGLGRLPDGYREAYVAVQSIHPEGGVVCLEDLSPFEYLALRSDATAHHLVSPAIADFLAEDAGKSGTLTRTLLAYVEADLNVSSAAEQLFIHPNTAHYRLARIAEKTGRAEVGQTSGRSAPAPEERLPRRGRSRPNRLGAEHHPSSESSGVPPRRSHEGSRMVLPSKERTRDESSPVVDRLGRCSPRRGGTEDGRSRGHLCAAR